MVRNLVPQPKSKEPAIGHIDLDILDQLPFGPEPDFPVADLCAGAPCTAILPPEIGDCDGDLRVSDADLLTGVNMLLEVPGRGACSR